MVDSWNYVTVSRLQSVNSCEDSTLASDREFKIGLQGIKDRGARIQSLNFFEAQDDAAPKNLVALEMLELLRSKAWVRFGGNFLQKGS